MDKTRAVTIATLVLLLVVAVCQYIESDIGYRGVYSIQQNDTSTRPKYNLTGIGMPDFLVWLLPSSTFPFITWYHVIIGIVIFTAYKINENKSMDAKRLSDWIYGKLKRIGRYLKELFS